MDKETLSNYGWVVICVLVMVVMIALATPFGQFISNAVKSTTSALFGATQERAEIAGLDIEDVVFPCDHEYEDYICTKCGAIQEHEHDYVNQVCSLCGDIDYIEYELTQSYSSRAFLGIQGQTEVVIPETIYSGGKWYKVTSIGNDAFEGPSTGRSPYLTSIVIPDSVTNIGRDAFNGQNKMTSITMSKNVKSIGIAAFNGCKLLTKIDLYDGLETIGAQAFCYCEGLKEMIIPDSVTTIGTSICYQCYGLEKLVISKNIEEYPMNAFTAMGPIKNIVIPDGVKIIGVQMFRSSDIESITYKGITYTSRTDIMNALRGNGVTVDDTCFYYTKLTA